MDGFKGLLVDIDGTIYFKGQLIDGAVAFLQELKQMGVVIRYLTNTTGLSPMEIVARLNNYGLSVEYDELFNPIKVAQAYFEKHDALSYYVMAEDKIKAEFQGGQWDENAPDCVVLGDLAAVCDYDEINRVFNFISNGSRLMTTSYSPYYYASTGEKRIDTGAFARMFEASLQVKAEIIGKPSRLFYQMAIESTALATEECIMIGDDVDKDILGAKQCGLYSVLVQTGKYDEDYVQASGIVPDGIISSLPMGKKYFPAAGTDRQPD